MVKKETIVKATKTAIATGVLLSTVAPYSVQAATTYTTAAELTTAINALNPKADGYTAAVDAIEVSYKALGVEQNKLTKATTISYNNHINAVVVIKKIDTVIQTAADTLTEDTIGAVKVAIANAKADQKALSMTARSYVTNYTALTTYEADVTKQEKYLNNLVAMDGFLKELDKITTSVDLGNVAVEDFEKAPKYTDDELKAITTARAEYAKLTSVVKQSVLPANLKKLTNAEQQAKYQATLTAAVNKGKVDKFTNLVTALNPSAEDYATQVEAVESEYEKLEASVKSALPRATTIMYDNHKAAKAVVVEIAGTTKLEAIEAADQGALDTIVANLEKARTNYLALSTTPRSYVKNYTDLTGFEAAAKARQAALNNADALSAWDEAYDKIAALTVHGFTDKTAADYPTMDKYGDTELPLIQTAVEEYAKLTAILKTYVGAAKAEKLVALEKAAADQAALKADYDKQTAAEDAIVAELAAWKEKVAALPADVVDFAGLTGKPGDEPHDTAFNTAKYQEDAVNSILAARAAYTALSAAAKDRVTFDDYKNLTDHEAALSKQNDIQAKITAAKAQVNKDLATAFETTVTDLKTWTVAADYQTAVNGVNTAYTALEAEVQALVSTAIKTELENHTAAAPVAVLVASASTTAEIEAVDATAEKAQDELNTLKTSVTTARTDYNALKAAQKGFVTNLAELTAKEAAINTKQAEISQEFQLKPFKDAMDTIGTTVHKYDDVTFKSELTAIKKYAENTVEDARTAYNNLTPALQAKVTDLYATLELHEAAYEIQKGLVEAAEAYQLVKTAVDAVETSIKDLGENALNIPELKDYVPEGDGATVLYTDIQQDAIEAAQQSFVALAENQKFVDNEVTKKLEEFHASLQKQIQLLAAYKDGEIAALKKKINGWSITTSTVLNTFIQEVADAKTAYGKFSPADFTAAETKKLNNYVAAMVVVDQILKLEDTYKDVTVSTDMDTYIQAAAAARNAYKALPSDQKMLVVNISDLTAYEKAVAAKQHELLVAENLADWKTVYPGIKDIVVLEFNEADFDYKDEASYYNPDQLDAIKAAQDAYDAIAPEYQASVDATEHQKLTDLQASILKYEELKATQIKAEQELEAALQPFKDALAALTPATPYDYTDKTVEDYKTVGEYTPEEEQKINAAQEALAAIEESFASKVEQADKDKLQSYVDSLTTFTKFVNEAANKDAIEATMQPWTEAFAKIKDITPKGYVDTITPDNVGTTNFEEHEPETKNAVDIARKAFDALATNEEFTDLQTRVLAEDLKVLTDLEAEIKAYNTANTAKINAEKAAKKEELLNAINALDIVKDTYKQDVEAAKLLYMAMTPEVKAEFQAESAEVYAKFVNHQAVATVIDLVTAVGTVADIEATKTTVELEPIQAKITAARTAYKALTAAQQALYADTALVALEDAAAAQATALQNATKIAAWTTGYAALPALVELDNVTATTYSTTERQAITALRDVFTGYDAQTQALVDTAELQKLEALEAALKQQDFKITEAEQMPKLADFKAALAAITFDAIDFTNTTLANFEKSERYTESQLTLIATAEAEFDKLAEESKKYLTKEEQTKYDALVAGATKQKELQMAFDAGVAEEEAAAKLAAFVTAVTNLDPTLETYVADVEKVKVQYTELAELSAKLTRAQEINYTNHTTAVEVVKLINTATAPELLEAATTLEALTNLENEVNAAKTAYTALSTTARSYVYAKNYNAVTTTLAAITAKKKAIQNAEAIQDWTAGYEKLPGLLDFANVSYESIADAITYTPGEITAVEDLRKVYNGYTATVKGYVAKEEVAQLEAIEKAIARQKELQDQAGNAATITEKLADWKTAFAKLPAVIDMEGITIADIEKYKYAEGTEENVKAARAAYTAIEAAYKTFVTPADLQKLVDLEQSLVIYNKVNNEILAGQAEEDAAPVIEAFTNIELGSETFVEDAIKLKADFDGLSDAAKAEFTRANQIIIADYGTAAQVMKDITALPTADAIKETTDKTEFEAIQTQVKDARTAYNSLSMTARSYVSNYTTTLAAIEAAVKLQATVIENQEFLVTWNAAVDGLPEFIDISNMTTATYEETYDGDAQLQITIARTEYAKLSSIVKSTVDAADLELLVNLENAVKHQTALESQLAVVKVAEFDAILRALNPAAEDYVAAVGEMEAAYTALSEVVKLKVSASSKINMNNHIAAVKVVTAINDIALAGEAAEQIADYKKQVTEARAAYTILSKTARTYVTNYAILAEHEANVKLLP